MVVSGSGSKTNRIRNHGNIHYQEMIYLRVATTAGIEAPNVKVIPMNYRRNKSHFYFPSEMFVFLLKNLIQSVKHFIKTKIQGVFKEVVFYIFKINNYPREC